MAHKRDQTSSFVFTRDQTNPLGVRRLNLELQTFSLKIELNNNSMIRYEGGGDCVQDVLNQAASFNKEEALLKGDEHQGKEHDDDDETTQKGIMIEVELDPLNMINSFPILA